VGQNDCVGHFAPEKRALELAAFKPADRTAQNAAPIAATADRSVKPAYDDDNLRERTLTDYKSVQLDHVAPAEFQATMLGI
jgi:hypothetical protein